jgi:hypothetical protein
MKQDNQQYSPEETERRLRAILKGATKGPPTPLKAIPRKRAESRDRAKKK